MMTQRKTRQHDVKGREQEVLNLVRKHITVGAQFNVNGLCDLANVTSHHDRSMVSRIMMRLAAQSLTTGIIGLTPTKVRFRIYQLQAPQEVINHKEAAKALKQALAAQKPLDFSPLNKAPTAPAVYDLSCFKDSVMLSAEQVRELTGRVEKLEQQVKLLASMMLK
jgi:hypothetical protein